MKDISAVCFVESKTLRSRWAVIASLKCVYRACDVLVIANVLCNAILSRVTSLRTFATSASFARGFSSRKRRESKDAGRRGAFRWSVKHAATMPIIVQIRGQQRYLKFARTVTPNGPINLHRGDLSIIIVFHDSGDYLPRCWRIRQMNSGEYFGSCILLILFISRAVFSVFKCSRCFCVHVCVYVRIV